MTQLPMPTLIRFPNRTVERLALTEVPYVGDDIDAREGRWRVTKVRMPWSLDRPTDFLYDIDVEPAPDLAPPDGL